MIKREVGVLLLEFRVLESLVIGCLVYSLGVFNLNRLEKVRFFFIL